MEHTIWMEIKRRKGSAQPAGEAGFRRTACLVRGARIKLQWRVQRWARRGQEELTIHLQGQLRPTRLQSSSNNSSCCRLLIPLDDVEPGRGIRAVENLKDLKDFELWHCLYLMHIHICVFKMIVLYCCLYVPCILRRSVHRSGNRRLCLRRRDTRPSCHRTLFDQKWKIQTQIVEKSILVTIHSGNMYHK